MPIYVGSPMVLIMSYSVLAHKTVWDIVELNENLIVAEAANLQATCGIAG